MTDFYTDLYDDKADTLDSPDIAIIGLAGRFPGARNYAQFWQNLRDGVESIRFFSPTELAGAGIDPETLKQSNYVRAAAMLDDIEWFDAPFFNISGAEAQITDPQHRLALECAWEALEDAGYDPARYDGPIGVYLGAPASTYLQNNLWPNRTQLQSTHSLQLEVGNDKDFIPTRISYKLNLNGPSMAIGTACSTALVAVHMACQSLLDGESDMALAGAITVWVPQQAGYLYQPGLIFSPDGHCRPFDADASGTIMGSGLGFVTLKRLGDALADGDHIYAVIKGSALNNDGSAKVGYTAPSVEGQSQAIAAAQAIAGVDPASLGYVEAHGTGTKLGDPIEIEALTLAFRAATVKTSFCAIGSVKGNIGHLDRAAGVAGIIKIALMLKYKMLVPSLNFKRPNPQINFADSPFYVNTSLRPWPNEALPRRAGVSAFGFGGTNAHLILEEALPVVPSGPGRAWHLLPLSAKTAPALKAVASNLAIHLRQHSDLNLADVAYTLQVGRQPFEQRQMVLCQNQTEAIAALEKVAAQPAHTAGEPAMVFLFPGQGAQYVDMARQLYQTEPYFGEQIDQCAELLKPHLALDLRSVLYPTASQAAQATEYLRQSRFIQPALFSVTYALARLWQFWGVQPAAMFGHSVGEYVAACLAGVFSLADGLRLVATLGHLTQQLPQGVMLAVPLAAPQLMPLLSADLSLAASNSPQLTVVSGPTAAIAALEKRLAGQGVLSHRLETSHAFHSALMDPILADLTAAVQQIQLQPPQIPYISSLTGIWITSAEATDPGYWARQLRQPVYFSEGIQQLWQEPGRILLEVGPGRTLHSLVSQQPQAETWQVFSTLRQLSPGQRVKQPLMLKTLGQLWQAGMPVNWANFHAHHRRQRVPLPTYPFQRQRYWIDPPQPASSLSRPAQSTEGLSSQPSAVTIQAMQLQQAARRQAAPRQGALLAQLQGLSLAEQQTHLSDYIRAEVADLLGFGVAEEVPLQQRLFEIGLNAELAVALRNRLEADLGQTLRSMLVFDYPTVAMLADYLAGVVETQAQRSAADNEVSMEKSEEDVADLLAKKLTELE